MFGPARLPETSIWQKLKVSCAQEQQQSRRVLCDGCRSHALSYRVRLASGCQGIIRHLLHAQILQDTNDILST